MNAAAITRDTLPNGLVILVEERRSAETVALNLAARAGAREDGSTPGLTAFTVRMMGQGTPRHPSESDLQRAAAQVGGTFGAGSAVETSSFTSVMPAREVNTGFDLIADVLLNALFDPDALERQRGLTLQAISQRRASPEAVLADLYQETLFGSHPVATPPAGTEQSVAAFTRADVLAHRERFFGAANLVLGIAGRITAEDAVARARRFFGALPTGTRYARQSQPAVSPARPRTVRGEVGQAQAQFRLGFLAPSLLAEDHFPIRVLNAITGGANGRLFNAVRSERGLAYTAGSAYPGTSYTDTGTYFAAAGVDPQNLAAAIDVTRDEIQRLHDEPPSAQEVAEVATRVAGQQVVLFESNAAHADRLVSREILGTPPVEELVRRLRAVTPADVQRVARAYLDFDRAVLAVVGPAEMSVPELPFSGQAPPAQPSPDSPPAVSPAPATPTLPPVVVQPPPAPPPQPTGPWRGK